jgi:hypothetical protein
VDATKMSTIILADKGDEQKIIEEEKAEWVFQELLAILIDFNIEPKVAEEMVVELDNSELITYLTSLEVEIFDSTEGSVEIVKKGKTIAQWKRPKLTMRVEKNKGATKDRANDKKILKDLRNRKKIGDRKYKKRANNFYYEIELNEWRLRDTLKKKR